MPSFGSLSNTYRPLLIKLIFLIGFVNGNALPACSILQANTDDKVLPQEQIDHATAELSNVVSFLSTDLSESPSFDFPGIMLLVAGWKNEQEPEVMKQIFAFRQQARHELLNALEAKPPIASTPHSLLLRILNLTTREPNWFGESLEANFSARKRLIDILQRMPGSTSLVEKLLRDRIGVPGKSILFDLTSRQGFSLPSRTPLDLLRPAITIHKDSAYWINSKNRLQRLSASKPELAVDVASVPEKGLLHFTPKDRVYVLGKHVWTAKDIFSRLEQIPAITIEAKHLMESSHYGKLVRLPEGIFQITWPESKVK